MEGLSSTCLARDPSVDLKPAGVSGSAGALAAKISIQRPSLLQGPSETQPKLPNVPRDNPCQGGLPHSPRARGGMVKSWV